ncbi:MAG: DNA gyrase subunit A [Bacteroidales bacterium]|nr:DNA gyrase subunit A [Bacteroidales bacterium]
METFENTRGEIIQKVNIEQQMQEAYIDYSMSVIVSRALPDVRDGLKPVQRRVLYGMYELGNLSNRPHKKSARIVGEVLGKYHPHGDSSVYEAMVRMAQDWSMRYTLIDGQGNFGSIDGDPPAAMRYTEARLNKLAEEMLVDLDKDTVDFRNNFDDTLQEPVVLPAKVPNLLINGASGIAVGMATNMAPHNLSEVIDAIIAYIDNKEITLNELLNYIKAPDFPTGGIIYGYEGVKEAFASGRGKIVIRGKANIEVENNKAKIIITEIPYLVNKSELIKRIADLVNENKLEGISDINDESDREGMRIVIEIKKDANANVVLNNLYKYTPLQSTFNVNNICLVNGRPKLLNLIELIKQYVDHRHIVIIRRTKYELKQAEIRSHILKGLLIALEHIDEVIALIKSSQTVEIAKTGLMQQFGLDEEQSKAILSMRLQTLTALESTKLQEEFGQLQEKIAYLNKVLNEEPLRMQIIKDEIIDLKKRFGDERKTKIEYVTEELNPEDFYANESAVITISHLNYVKRTPLDEYRLQNRGGIGLRASDVRDEDYIEHVYVTRLHNTLLLFTDKGKCYWLKAYEIPEGERNSRGRPIQNIINIDKDDKIKAYVHVEDLNDKNYTNTHYIVFCTKQGLVKKTPLSEFDNPRSTGIIAINIRENDELIEAKLTNGNYDIIIATKNGRSVRFKEDKVRPMGRNATGVKGITLSSKDDEVIGMVCVENEKEDILVVSENGFGKRTKINEYPVTNRGGKGVKTLNITKKTGKLIAIKGVIDTDHLMIITKNGIAIRINVKNIKIIGRLTQGVKLINLRNNDEIASVTYIDTTNEQESDKENDNNNNNIVNNFHENN